MFVHGLNICCSLCKINVYCTLVTFTFMYCTSRVELSTALRDVSLVKNMSARGVLIARSAVELRRDA